MISTKLTRQAMILAYNVHKNQFDKSNVPYIYHPIHLAEQMDSEEACTVALLHDVVEDSDVTFDDLKETFPEEVIEALRLLTHNEEVDYFTYIQAIRSNDIARKVKMADLVHNSDITRLDEVTEEDKARVRKYQKALKLLK